MIKQGIALIMKHQNKLSPVAGEIINNMIFVGRRPYIG